jgi:hypothetical protein
MLGKRQCRFRYSGAAAKKKKMFLPYMNKDVGNKRSAELRCCETCIVSIRQSKRNIAAMFIGCGSMWLIQPWWGRYNDSN